MAVFEVESGVSSIFLDLPLLEATAGIKLVSIDSDATPFSEEFQTGFPITEETNFRFESTPFTPLDGTIKHSGTITISVRGFVEATIGNFSVGFDPSRISKTTSGFFISDTLNDPLGLEILFDISALSTIEISGDQFQLSDADLLLAPELATTLAAPELAGNDFGNGRIDANISATATGIPLTATDISTTATDDDILRGTPDVDQINGLAGDDILVGGEGDDLLDGKEGADIFIGGVGADVFVLRADPIPGTNDFDEDFIVDFVVAEGDVFVLPVLPDGTPVTFEMLQIDSSSRGGISGTEIEVMDEEIAFIAHVAQEELINNPGLFMNLSELSDQNN